MSSDQDDMSDNSIGSSLPVWLAAIGAGLLLGVIVWLWTLHGESIYFTQLTSFIANCF
ncbi:MAG: hypothetical protein R3D34_11790 [Nitratireductor sp.]